jgi:hypothetical protein
MNKLVSYEGQNSLYWTTSCETVGDESFIYQELEDSELKLCVQVHDIVPKLRKMDKKLYDYNSFK